jgi:sugar lactone lactonase YvrE
VQRFGTSEAAYLEDTTHINSPYGVAADGTNVVIADSSGNRALKFTSSGSFVMQIGRAGFRYGASGTELEWIADVAVDSSGNIWLVDGFAEHIAKFSSSGSFLSELGRLWNGGSGNDQFRSPRSIAFDSSGNIYVSDSGNHRIQVLDSSGTYSTTIGQTGVPGSDNAHFNEPRHIAIDSSDNLYVADAANHRVQIFNSSHVYFATIGVSGVPGNDNAHFDWPMGVAVDSGRIYVADGLNHRIQIFDRTTRIYLNTIGTGTAGSGNNQFDFPSDVAVDLAGNISVADQVNQRVQQFNSSLAYVRTFGTTGVPYVTDGYHYNRPSGVAIASDGSIYLTEEAGARLLKLNAAGVPQWTIGEPGLISGDNSHLSGPSDVDLDNAGQVYIADAWNHRIQIFTSLGAYSATLGTGLGTGCQGSRHRTHFSAL